MPRFFMSHNERDKPLVLAVDQILKSLGLTVWTDKWEIKAGDSLIEKIVEEGLEKSDYVCAFISKFSVRSRWVRKELWLALTRSLRHGKPRIIVLRFDGVKVPAALSDLHYADLARHELSAIIAAITSSANLDIMDSKQAPKPYQSNDFHDALRVGNVIYLLASRPDELDFDPYFDGEGVVFKRRHMYVFRVDRGDMTLRYHYLSRARPGHTAMRIVDDDLNVFINDKVENNTFSMDGRLFKLNADSLQTKSVRSIFSNRNWGWNPVVDEHGNLLHKSFDESGNPVRKNDELVPDMSWRELCDVESACRSEACPFEIAHGPGRETGYLRFLAVDRDTFDSLTDYTFDSLTDLGATP